MATFASAETEHLAQKNRGRNEDEGPRQAPSLTAAAETSLQDLLKLGSHTRPSAVAVAEQTQDTEKTGLVLSSKNSLMPLFEIWIQRFLKPRQLCVCVCNMSVSLYKYVRIHAHIHL